jgi:hypothetical protein
MAFFTIGLLGVMAYELRIGMAAQAASAVVLDAFANGWIEVWIVACGAGESVSRGAFARAVQ